MTRKILIAIAAAALVGGAFVPAASARDEYHDDHDRHGYRDHDRGDRGGYHDRHDRGPREVLYVIRYHLDGGAGRVKVKSGDRAERVVDLLRSVGADAHIDGSRVVHFKMRGHGRIVRRSGEDAYRLAQKLEGYGFHARVERG